MPFALPPIPVVHSVREKPLFSPKGYLSGSGMKRGQSKFRRRDLRKRGWLHAYTLTNLRELSWFDIGWQYLAIKKCE